MGILTGKDGNDDDVDDDSDGDGDVDRTNLHPHNKLQKIMSVYSQYHGGPPCFSLFPIVAP